MTVYPALFGGQIRFLLFVLYCLFSSTGIFEVAVVKTATFHTRLSADQVFRDFIYF